MVVTSDIDWKPAAAPTVARFLLPKVKCNWVIIIARG